MEEPKANLKPCPCCGGRAEMLHRIQKDLGCYLCFAWCCVCSLRTHDELYFGDKNTPIEKAARAAVREVEAVWNRRDG